MNSANDITFRLDQKEAELKQLTSLKLKQFEQLVLQKDQTLKQQDMII